MATIVTPGYSVTPGFRQFELKIKQRIRIVGNAKGLNFEMEKTHKRRKNIIAAIIQKNPSEIWWDGDGYKSESFTQIIKDLVQIQNEGQKLQETTFRSVCVVKEFAPKINLFESNQFEKIEESIPIETFNNKSLESRLADSRLSLLSITAESVGEKGWKGKYVRMGILSTVGNNISEVYCFGGGANVEKEKEIVTKLGLGINYIDF
jgi:hypothetical protein